jgi:hypothetical protein
MIRFVRKMLKTQDSFADPSSTIDRSSRLAIVQSNALTSAVFGAFDPNDSLHPFVKK